MLYKSWTTKEVKYNGHYILGLCGHQSYGQPNVQRGLVNVCCPIAVADHTDARPQAAVG